MAGEHAFLQSAIPDLEAGLLAAGVGTGADKNQYALVGFGGTDATSQVAHKHPVGGSDFGSASDFSTAAGGLVVSGGLEDGYQAIDFALNNYTFRSGNFARQIILVTDEDRDVNNSAAGGNTQGSLINFTGLLNDLKGAGVTLNAIVNNPFLASDGTTRALGIKSNLTVFLADGSGGFTTDTGGSIGNGFGTTETDYVPLAHQTGGAAWDLNLLRAGGNTATSFAAAFIDTKVQEIITPPALPIPSTLILLGVGLVGWGLVQRQRR
ncbi:MAG: PEP-CTERM sorting domain-containing protein [Nitrospirae bacterium]|nr:MAG: PEP-CTERM sorting domain-containing protein [Nitrospirota bacterium]